MKNSNKLTPRQQELVMYLLEGLRNRQIGEAMGIGESTVKIMLTDIFKRTGYTNRVELILGMQKESMR